MTRGARAAAIAVACFASGAGTSPLAVPIDGYVITQRITSEREPAPFTMVIKVAQGHVRIDLPQAPGTGAPSAYMVLRDDGKVSLVIPAQRGVVITDAATMAGGAPAMNAMASSEVTDVSVEFDDLGAGDTTLGHATHKYRARHRYTFAITERSGPSHRSTHDVTTTFVVATDLPAFAEGLDRYLDAFGNAFAGMPGGTSRNLVESLRGKLPPGAFPLHTVVDANSADPSGQVSSVHTAVDVLYIAKATFDASDFQAPADYRVITPGGRGGH